MIKKILISLCSLVLLSIITYFSFNVKVVKFKVLDENITKRQIRLKRNYLKEPKVNLKENKVIEGWYSDQSFQEEWLFDANKVYENITLYAKTLNYIKGTIYRDDLIVSDIIYN